MGKKILSLVLCCALVIALLPMGKIQAAAYDDAQALITEGQTLMVGSDGASAAVITWVQKVRNFNNKYPNSSVYSDLDTVCANALANGIFVLNNGSKILGYLNVLRTEVPLYSTLYSITVTPTKTSYAIGDKFDKTSLKVEACYQDINVNNQTSYRTSAVTGFYTDRDGATLNSKDTLINVYYTENGVTKSTSFSILVGQASSTGTIIDTSTVSKYKFVNPTIQGLANQVYSLTSYFDAAGYMCARSISDFNNKYPKSSVYNDLKARCNKWQDAKTTSDSSFKSGFSKEDVEYIMYCLMILDTEIPVSTTFDSLTATTTKTEYDFNSKIDKSTVKVEAVYKSIYSDGHATYENKAVTNWTTDKDNKALTTKDTYFVVSYTEDGITKTAYVYIVVKPDPNAESTEIVINDGNDGSYKLNDTVTWIEPVAVPSVVFKTSGAYKRSILTLTQIDGVKYEIQLSTKKSFKKNYTTGFVTSNNVVTIKNLKLKVNYYVRVRAYKVVNGVKMYSDWSKTYKVKL